ncbi:MAG: NERD domain-containing protein [Verrucomicrobia bacterium]|jgi:hypothetical protein|nr:NERD domain-containing protein [Verrucomicrobiota bacterium]
MTDLSADGRPARYARVFGSPGTRVRMAGLLRTQWPLLIVVALTGYLLRAALPVPAMGSTLAGALFLVLAVAVAAAANHSRRRLQAFLKGAHGEELVARALARLPETFAVFHGIAADSHCLLSQGGGDLDHVVVGPAGLFVIETKNWSGDLHIENGELTADGEQPSRPPLEQVKRASSALKARLQHAAGVDIEITPILCFASNRLRSGVQGSSGVLVCNADQITSVILEFHETPLSDTTRQKLIEVLQEDCER